MKNMDNELISVVVPVYNVEKYVKDCVDSILNQSYKQLEIILVDDGSTDSSGFICDKFCEENKNIKVIHKENGGLSDARNVAIDISTGQYITFIDSDDTIKEDYISFLYKIAIDNQCDISICDFEYVNEKGKLLNNIRNSGNIVIYDRKTAIRNLVEGKEINSSASMKLYRTQLFEGIRYPKGKIYEDLATTYKLFLKANKIVRGDKALYIYLYRKGSITKRKYYEKKMDMIYNAQNMCQDIEKVYPELKDCCNTRLFSQYITAYVEATNSGCDKKIKEYLYMLIKDISNEKIVLSNKKTKIYYFFVKKSRIGFEFISKMEYCIKSIRNNLK